MKLFINLLLLIISLDFYSQNMNFDKTYGSSSLDEPLSVFNINNNVFVFSNINYSSISSGNIGITFGGIDINMIVYNSSGIIIKNKTFGGLLDDKLLKVQLVDSVFHLMCYSYSQNGLGKNSTNSLLNDNYNLTHSNKYQEIYIIKISTSGIVLEENAYNITNTIYFNTVIGDWESIGNVFEQNPAVPYGYIQNINGADFYNGLYHYNMNILDTVKKNTETVWRYPTTSTCTCGYDPSNLPAKEYFTIDNYYLSGSANVDLSFNDDYSFVKFDNYNYEIDYVNGNYFKDYKVKGYNVNYCDSVAQCREPATILYPNPPLCSGVTSFNYNSWSDPSFQDPQVRCNYQPFSGTLYKYDTYSPFIANYDPITFFPLSLNYDKIYKVKYLKNNFIKFKTKLFNNSYVSTYFPVKYNSILLPVIASAPNTLNGYSGINYIQGTEPVDAVYNKNSDKYYCFTQFKNTGSTNGSYFYGLGSSLLFRDYNLAPANNSSSTDIFITEHTENNVNGFISYNTIRQKSIRANNDIIINSVSDVFDSNKVLISLSTISSVGYDKTTFSKGGFDYWLVKFNLDKMSIVWDTSFGGSSNDYLFSAHINDGSISLTGSSVSSIGGNKTENQFGSGDIWTINYCYNPKVNFISNKITGIQGELIEFTNLSQNGFNYTWDFGDNSLSFEKNPEHYFNNYGFHTVKLTAYNGSCSSSLIKNNYINISQLVSIKDIDSALERSFFPNPTTEKVKYSNNLKIKKIINSLGQEYSMNNNEAENILKFENSGIYFIEYENIETKDVNTVKIIVYE